MASEPPPASGSLWPVPTALGVAGIYATGAVALLGDRLRLRVLVPAAMATVTLLAVGTCGWLTQMLRSRANGSFSPAANLAVWSFLGVEAVTFLTALVYLLWLQASAWPLGNLPPLHPFSLAAATLVLAGSSATLHAAQTAHDRDDGWLRRWYLDATVVLGVLFLAGQAGAYHSLIAAGYTPTTSAYSSALFGLTALHGLHVGAGLGGLFALQVSSRRSGTVSTTALVPVVRYWHFVDVVWLCLVATLYLGVRLIG